MHRQAAEALGNLDGDQVVTCQVVTVLASIQVGLF